MARPEKQATVREVKDKLDKSAAVVLTEFTKLSVQELGELRSQLRGQGIDYKVYKNTLVRRAVADLGLSDLDPLLVGPTAMAFGYADPVSVAKILLGFTKAHKTLKLKGGLLEGRVIDGPAVESLAMLPSREVLISQLCGSLNAPLSGLANVLAGPMRNFVGVLRAIADQAS